MSDYVGMLRYATCDVCGAKQRRPEIGIIVEQKFQVSQYFFGTGMP